MYKATYKFNNIYIDLLFTLSIVHIICIQNLCNELNIVHNLYWVLSSILEMVAHYLSSS